MNTDDINGREIGAFNENREAAMGYIVPPEDNFPGRRVQISQLIRELQTIHERWGDTCCYITGLAWGSVALWRESWADALKADPTPEMIESAAKAIDRVAKDRLPEHDTYAAAAIAAYRKAIGAAV